MRWCSYCCVQALPVSSAGTASVRKQRAFLALKWWLTTVITPVPRDLASGLWKQVAASMCPLGKADF